MRIWTIIKTKLRNLAHRRCKKEQKIAFPVYCKIHGVKRRDAQGALAQSREGDKLQLVHIPIKDYPYNVYVYSVPLNRVLGYLESKLSQKLVNVFGEGFCRDGEITTLTGGMRMGYQYMGCNICILKTMRYMQNCEDFSHLYGAW